MIVLLAIFAHADPGVDADIVRPLGSFGEVNWTDMVVTATGDAQRRTTEGLEGVEASAERVASSALRLAIERVQVQNSLTVGELLNESEIGKQVATRMLKRTISKVTYGERDDVALELTLPLSDLLKPWTWQRLDEPTGEASAVDASGLIIDARGHRVDPAWAPRIIDSEGSDVYTGQLSAAAIRRVSPAVYVRNAASDAASRAGPNPIFVGVQKVRGSEFFLSEAGTQIIAGDASVYDRLLEGHLVIVMDP